MRAAGCAPYASSSVTLATSFAPMVIAMVREAVMVNKIVEAVSAETLQADLESFRQHALHLGATDAKIIASGQVIVDERVRAKCMNPKCHWYGTNGNCPPHAPDLDTVRNTVGRTGDGCRMGMRARQAMESWGIDAYMMAVREGWEVYPVGVNTQTEDVPFRVALGLVLVH